MKNFKAVAPRMRRELQGLFSVNTGRTRKYITVFLKDFRKPYWERLKEIEQTEGYRQPMLSDLVPPEFRYLYKPDDLRNTASFLKELKSEASNFTNKDTLIVAINFYTFYVLFLSRVAENMCLASSQMDDYSLDSIGLSRRIMQYYRLFGTLRQYNIEEWKSKEFSDSELQYINLSFVRLFKLFGL